MNEFSYIIFSRWTNKPSAHGATEQQAWHAVVRRRFPDRYPTSELDFTDPTIHQFTIDHKALSCGLYGLRIWEEILSLSEAEHLIEQALK